MAKRCTKCGNFMMDDERFCPNCGENAQNAAVMAPPPQPYQQQNTYQQPGQQPGQQPYQQQPTYQQPYPAAAPSDNEMSLGKWVVTLIVTTFFGLISIIFLFVWGFGDGPESRRRFCKAYLIVSAISFVLGMVMFFMFFGLIASAADSISGDYGNFDWSNYSANFTSLMAILSARIG